VLNIHIAVLWGVTLHSAVDSYNKHKISVSLADGCKPLEHGLLHPMGHFFPFTNWFQDIRQLKLETVRNV